MFYSANYFFNPYSLPSLLVGLAVGALGVLVLIREKRSLISFVFVILTTLVMLWLFATVGLFSSSTTVVAYQWIKIKNSFVVFIPSLLFVFTLVIVRRLKELSVLAWSALAVSVYFMFSVLLTDLFVSGVYEYFWGYYSRYSSFSVWFIVFFFLTILLSLVILAAHALYDASPTQQKRLRVLLVAFTVGFLGSIDFIAAYGREFYPAGYLPVLGFVALAAGSIWRYHLVDITPAFAAREIIQHMSDALIVLDADGLIRIVNRATREVFGFDERDLLEKKADVFLPDIFAGQIDILRQHGRIPESEVAYLKHGEERFLSFNASVIRDDKGRQVAFVFIARDVSDRKKADKALLDKTSELARSKAELEQLELFAFVASHDLQEPLRKITTFGNRLRESATMLDEKNRDFLSRMESAAARMSQYISDLVDFSRVSSRQNPYEPVDLAAVIQEVLTDLDLRIQEVGARIDIKPMPVLNADRLQMRQLFQNLIANALKFSKRDGQTPEIRITCVHREGWIDLIVADNGIGFDEKYAERIFRPFERLHRSEEIQGSGMGLAICHRITLRHQGRIQARSKLGEGSTFTVSLPI